MLIKAYDKTYLEDVADNLGTMLEYAVGYLGISLTNSLPSIVETGTLRT